MKRIKKLLYLTLLIFAIAGIVGCNTIEGMGKDIEKGGEKIQDVVK